MIKKVAVHTTDRVTMDEIISQLKKNPRFREVGAIISFTGIVKGVARDGKELSKIEMEMDPARTEERLREIAAEYEKNPLIQEVCIHMSVGELGVSEVISHIAVSTTCDGPQVGEIFKAVHEILEEVKRTAGLRLKEKGPEGWYYTKPEDKTKTFD